MVITRIAKRYIVQQLAKRFKPGFTKYISQQYGAAAGTAAGIGFSIAAGDYYGALTGITGQPRTDSPYDRDPPIGYYDPVQGGNGLNGSTNGSFHKTLRPTGFTKYRRRGNRRTCNCRSYGNKRSYRRRRSRGRYKY